MSEVDWRWFNSDWRGWFSIPYTGLGTVYLQATKVDGRWRVTQLYVDGDERPIDPKALRGFPLSRVEEEMAGQARLSARMCEESPELGLSYPMPGPDLRGLLSDLSPKNATWAGMPPPAPPREPITLTYDPQAGLTDDFLSDVARAYSWAIRERKPPATELARQAGVSVRTAQSWIYKARKRGLMPPATRRGRIV